MIFINTKNAEVENWYACIADKPICSETLVFDNIDVAFQHMPFFSTNKVVLQLGEDEKEKIARIHSVLLHLQNFEVEINEEVIKRLLQKYPGDAKYFAKSKFKRKKLGARKFSPTLEVLYYNNACVYKSSLFSYPKDYFGTAVNTWYDYQNNKTIYIIAVNDENPLKDLAKKSKKIDKNLVILDYRMHTEKLVKEERNYIKNDYILWITEEQYEDFDINCGCKYCIVNNKLVSIYVKPKTYIYSFKNKKEYFELKTFHLGYEELGTEVVTLSPFRIERFRNDDYIFYSEKSVDFQQNFHTYRIYKNIVKGTIEFVYFGEKMKLLKSKFCPKEENLDEDTRYVIEENRIKIISNKTEKETVLEKDVTKLLCRKNKKIFLFQDRETKSDDSAEVLYEYYMGTKEFEEHEMYFVISQKCPDYLRLANKHFRLVNFGSVLHKQLFLIADFVVTTHAAERVYSPFGRISEWKKEEKFKFIFLQHGIIMGSHRGFLDKFNKVIDMFVTSTAEETRIVQEFSGFDNVVLTGLPRYDNYTSLDKMQNEQYILYAPSWNVNYRDNFDESDYYKKIIEVVSDVTINEQLRESGVKIKLALHPEFAKFTSKFTFLNSDIFEAIDINENSYKELLISCSALITDYSSLLFDVMYMEKPVISYTPYELHHENNEMQKHREIMMQCEDIDEFRENILQIIDESFILSEQKKELTKDFFGGMAKGQNSARVASEIRKLITDTELIRKDKKFLTIELQGIESYVYSNNGQEFCITSSIYNQEVYDNEISFRSRENVKIYITNSPLQR